MPLVEDKFDQHKIDSLKRYLQRESEKNRRKDYEILVDGFRVVSRTDDIEEFEDYEQEIKPGTRNVSILVYDGPGTNRNTRYSFSMQQDTFLGSNALNGPDSLGSIIQEKLDTRDREHEMSRLKEKLEEKEQQLAEAEEYSEKLEEKIKKLEEGEYKKMVGLGDVAGFVLNGWIRQNPNLITKLPGGNALAGLLDLPGADSPTNTTSAATEDAAVSFEKKGQPAADVNEQGWQQYRSQFESSFKGEQQTKVFNIVSKLSEQPELIATVAQLLNLENQ